jgi:hypothetical protein
MWPSLRGGTNSLAILPSLRRRTGIWTRPTSEAVDLRSGGTLSVVGLLESIDALVLFGFLILVASSDFISSARASLG